MNFAYHTESVKMEAENQEALAAAAPLQMDVDQIENLEHKLQANGPPPAQPSPPSQQINAAQNNGP